MIFSLFLLLAFTSYTLFLVPPRFRFDFLYIEGLLAILYVGYAAYCLWRKKKAREDMDHEHAIQEDLLSQLDQVRQKEKDLEDLIHSHTHELKAKLTTLRLCTAEQPNEIIESALEEADHTLNQMLLYAKLEAQYLNMRFERCDLQTLIYRSIKNNRFFLIQNHFELQIECEKIHVYTDPQWLVYVFDQILFNATKYKRDPKIEIVAQQNATSTTISIKDYGIGIAPYDLPLIFDQGFTGSIHHTGGYHSTGLGLYYAKSLLEKLDGEIVCRSQQSGWTEFILTLYNNPESSWQQSRTL